MEKIHWTLVNSENVVPFVCDETYSSRMLTGDEMAGMPIINVNEGTLKAGCRTEGGAHDDTEIYYMVDCAENTFVWLDDDRIPVKNGDIIVIPPHVFHWIDNTQSDKPFKLFTFWPRQELNGVFFARKNAWGTSVKYVDDDYTAKRLAGK
jgi:oxalate decarboxylase/phosphoglucose isomerase-like protein (cupin superfamily)